MAKIKLIQHAIVNGSVEWAGTSHDVDGPQAVELVFTNRAELVLPTEAEQVAALNALPVDEPARRIKGAK